MTHGIAAWISKPKNNTKINIHVGDHHETRVIYYGYYDDYKNLPDVAKSPETKKEYDEWHKWYRERK